MKSIKCDVIKDLLPSYSDRMLSDTSNQLVEEHLKQCESCSDILKNMNKEIDTETLFNQEEEIDYLKGYRKKSIATIIATIIVTILVICNCVLFVLAFLHNTEFSVDVQDIIVTCRNEEKVNEKNTFLFKLYDKNGTPSLKCYKYEVVEEETGKKALCIKIVGNFIFGQVVGGSTHVEIDETINKIYLEDKKGRRREIWNKEEGLQLIKEIYHY